VKPQARFPLSDNFTVTTPAVWGQFLKVVSDNMASFIKVRTVTEQMYVTIYPDYDQKP